jgi:hypothetical protein
MDFVALGFNIENGFIESPEPQDIVRDEAHVGELRSHYLIPPL